MQQLRISTLFFLLTELVNNRRTGCIACDIDCRTQHIEDTVDTEENRQSIDRNIRCNKHGYDEQSCPGTPA